MEENKNVEKKRKLLVKYFGKAVWEKVGDKTLNAKE